jgi:hypothetical protein
MVMATTNLGTSGEVAPHKAVIEKKAIIDVSIFFIYLFF